MFLVRLQLKYYFFSLLIIFGCGVSNAKKKPFVGPPREKLFVGPPYDSVQEKILKSNKQISNWFDSAAESIDLFLVGKQASSTPNPTSVHIENTSYSSEGKEVENTSNLGINLRLPNVEEYFQLKFTNYDEAEDKRGISRNYSRQTQRERNYGTSVGFFRNFGNIKTAFQPRIEFKNTFNLSHSLSFESEGKFDQYKFDPKLEFYTIADRGAGIFLRLNFSKEINKTYSFAYVNDANYEEKLHLFSVTNGVSLGQTISETQFMTYSWLFNSINRPKYNLNSYILAVTWRELLLKKIFEYRITPHLDFEKEKQFKGAAGLTLSLMLIF